jgi:hypothetical protein
VKQVPQGKPALLETLVILEPLARLGLLEKQVLLVKPVLLVKLVTQVRLVKRVKQGLLVILDILGKLERLDTLVLRAT